MSTAKSDLLHELSARGYIHQCTDEAGLDALARKEIVTGYIGFDCTAPSLHVGHLVSIMLLRKLQQTGHRPIVLIGGGTTKVGDPSGKDETRKLLDDATIASNIDSIQRVFSKFLDFGSGDQDALLLNNAEWLDQLGYISFLRDYGRHFSVNRMLSQDSVKLRLEREQNLSFIEFNYMVLQAYDFVELHRRTGCRLQMGGSDQWGNIVTGIELGRRTDGVELFGVTTPLLTTASGAKMGKTAAGAVWLNPDMLSPYDYWQFWRNAEDADVPRFLKLFTELPLDEIDRLAKLEGAELNEAKKILATEATAFVHGREAADQAAETRAPRSSKDSLPRNSRPSKIPRAELEKGFGVLTANVQVGFVKSTGEARRQIKGGGIKVNDVVVNDERAVLTPADLTADGVIKLSLGKKRHALIRPV
ncbi:tyrosine--tRNA ligase [Methyloceanibacter methanicus]|uniref:Tyrosine--tRNA ligase n=1 Tax=Methyloceanibacter methanicus TaxID=1774968 RepID=A0A1E3VZ93_9HYPH|nr:tyrosine--tRNA ligase [Methyloceanibacter methanicus]ODR98868.1 tyrosine--tRNA ligase [Methyloceanibacter methanicus]